MHRRWYRTFPWPGGDDPSADHLVTIDPGSDFRIGIGWLYRKKFKLARFAIIAMTVKLAKSDSQHRYQGFPRR